MERLVLPFLDKTRQLAFRLSPDGASEGMTRRLDLAGNPGTWTAERIMGCQGCGPTRRCRHRLGAGRVLFPRACLCRLRAALRVSTCRISCSRTWAEATGGTATWPSGLPRHDDGLCRGGTGLRRSAARRWPALSTGRSRVSSPEFSLRSRSGSRGVRPSAPLVPARPYLRPRTSSAHWCRPTGLVYPSRNVLREQSNQMRLVRRQRGRGEGPEGPGQDPLPDAALHLPGAVHRHHRSWCHQDRRCLLRHVAQWACRAGVSGEGSPLTPA